MKGNSILDVYLKLNGILRWVLGLAAVVAHRWQGASRARLGERFGRATRPRPPGRIIWVHAASVGEVLSALGLASALSEQTRATILFTTTTATGAGALAQRLPGALHQFQPIDSAQAVARFLTYWRPDLVLFIEGDIWPRTVTALAERGIPTALVNARASRSRARFPALYARLTASMALVTTQTPQIRTELVGLGLSAERVAYLGNLKAEAQIQGIDAAFQETLRAAAAGRPAWAAVSTHAGEEDLVIQAHAGLPSEALLVLVPRHPDRAATVARLAQRHGLATLLRSGGDAPGPDTRVFIVDSIGETGAVYSAMDIAFVGGSLVPGIGGHTPFEPARLGCAILAGSDVANFDRAYAQLIDAGAASTVVDATSLKDAVQALLSDPSRRQVMAAAGRAFIAREQGAARATAARVASLLASSGEQGGTQ